MIEEPLLQPAPSPSGDADGGDGFLTYTYYRAGLPPPRLDFEHDPALRVFRITTADGVVETFRDTPTRFLCVEPDPETGTFRPVRTDGQPVYLYLCREDREAR